MDKAKRVAQACRLFSLIARRTAKSTAYLGLTELLPGGARKNARQHFFPATKTGIQYAAKRAIDLCDQNLSDVYVRCSLLKIKPKKGARGTKKDTLGANILWVDIDPKGQTLMEIQKNLNEFFIKPSLTIMSGNGVHSYWRLDKINTKQDSVEGRNRWLAKQLDGDNCSDITHVLRVPGTYNFKDTNNPKLVKIITSDKLAHPAKAFKKLKPKKDHSQEEITLEPLPEDFLERMPSKLHRRIVKGPSGDEDRSANDWHVVQTLLRYNYTPGQILTVLCTPEWKVSGKTKQRGQQYAVTTIRRALDESDEKKTVAKSTVERVFLLTPVLDDVLYMRDEDNERKKKALADDATLYEPAYYYLIEHAGIKAYTSKGKEESFLVLPNGKVLETSDSSAVYRDWVTSICGFTRESREHRILRNGIATMARLEGTAVDLRPWCSLVKEDVGWTFRVLLGPDAPRVLKITEDGIEEVPNGEGGQLHFIAPNQPSILYNEKAQPHRGLVRFLKLFTSNIATTREQRAILTYYILMAPLAGNNALRTRPMLHLTGPSGGGKSQTMGMISTWLHGTYKLLNPTVASVYRMADKHILLPFDDYDSLSPALKQLMLTSVTGITRIKSDGSDTGTIEQEAHVLLALTSITELEDEALRRRAIVIEIDKDHFGRAGYHEGMWEQLAEERSYIWSAYINWLHQNVIPALNKCDWPESYRLTEESIPLGIFQGQASYLTWMQILARELKAVVPTLKLPITVDEWIEPLKFDDASELSERNPLLTVIAQLFEAVEALPGIDDCDMVDTYSELGYRVHGTTYDKMPEGYFGLEGTTTEWLSSLFQASGRQFKASARGLGHQFTRLIGKNSSCPLRKDGERRSKAIMRYGFVFIKMKGCGSTRASNGWRVLRKKETDNGA